MLFRFYCDESYDGDSEYPNTLTISGFFSDQPTWEEVEEQWEDINRQYGVSAFHATDLNSGWGEYRKWCRRKRVCYSKDPLHAVNSEKKRMRAYNCGMHADEYRKIISDAGRVKLGHPWIACFKSCIAMIARDMETLPATDTLSVVVEKGSGFDADAVRILGQLAGDPGFAYRHRLTTCAPSKPECIVGLQAADLMAYEYFKRLKDRARQAEMRPPLSLIREHNAYEEGFFGEATLRRMKNGIESAECGPDQLVITPSL